MDDSLLFFRAVKSDCEVIIDIFKSYEIAVGQVLNLNKSSL